VKHGPRGFSDGDDVQSCCGPKSAADVGDLERIAYESAGVDSLERCTHDDRQIVAKF
jgi:hypothetical protein